MNLEKELLDLIFELDAVNPEAILTAKTWKEAGIDSLDTIEIFMEVNDRYDIKIEEEDEEKLKNFYLLLEYVSKKIESKKLEL